MDSRLSSVNPALFSQRGFAELKLRIDGYVVDLVTESRRIAERHQADSISPAYVQRASEHLVSRTRRRRFTLIGTLGGIALGSSFSSFLDVASAAAPSTPQVLIAAVLGVLGAFCIALQFSQE
ncbi:MAG TPA: hypothetical protein VF746_17660 [Longimicrobium sp.]